MILLPAVIILSCHFTIWHRYEISTKSLQNFDILNLDRIVDYDHYIGKERLRSLKYLYFYLTDMDHVVSLEFKKIGAGLEPAQLERA